MEEKRKRNSWKEFSVKHQPEWSNTIELKNVLRSLEDLPALVFSGETRKLKEELAEVNTGKRFILQVGNCAESFSDCNGPKIHNFMRIISEMAIIIELHTNKKVIKIGRIAGQYAKPRSSSFELVNGIELPVYRGDIINDFEPTLEARIAKPKRLLDAYFRSAATLNLIRSFTQGGYSDVKNLMDWKEHFFSKEVSNLNEYKKFEDELSKKTDRISVAATNSSRNDIIYTSHESLLLDYEEAFARIDTTTGDWYSTSAHSLWIGDRTRSIESGHVEFASSIGNPIGIKVGPKYDIDELKQVINKINRSNEDGKIMLICRFGLKNIDDCLPQLIDRIKQDGLKVIWCCDPMHGNTFAHGDLKVRSFDEILKETTSFFKLCKSKNVVPGGIHLEITGEHVTECIGGINEVTLENLKEKYFSKVDPRLNATQAIEASFLISNIINN